MNTVAAGSDCLKYLDIAFTKKSIYQVSFTGHTPESITLLYYKLKGWCSAFLVQYSDESYCCCTFVSSVQCLQFTNYLYKVCKQLNITLL